MAQETDRERLASRPGSDESRGRWAVYFPLLILAIGLAVYGNTFNIPFYFNDKINILSNPALWDWGYFVDFSKVELAVFQGRLPADFMTRIVGYFTLAGNYHLHGFSLAGYHIFNLALHLGNGLLVYGLVLMTLELPGYLQGSGDGSGYSAALPALAAALVFTVHPVQTQAVVYISQRFVLLATFFYLLTLVAYIRWRLTPTASQHAGEAQTESPGWKRGGWYWLAVGAAMLAMLSREISFTLPLVILIYDRLFLNMNSETHSSQLAGGLVSESDVSILPYGVYPRQAAGNFNFLRRPPWQALAPFVFAWAIIPVLILWQGPEWYSELSSLLNSSESGWAGNYSYRYLLTQLSVLVTYLRLCFWPAGLRLDYDYPWNESFLQLPVLASFLLLALIGGCSLACYLRSRKQAGEGRTGLRLVAFGISWFFLALVVESSILPLKDAIFEHRMYLPLVGMLSAILGLYVFFRENLFGHDRKLLLLFLPLLLALVAATFSRNALWAEPIAFWEDNLAKSPGKGRVHYNLAEEYVRVGRLDDAIARYKAAISFGPGARGAPNPAYKALSRIYGARGEKDLVRENSENALNALQAAIKKHGDNKILRNEEGVLLGELQRWQEAEQAFRKAYELEPAYAISHMNLGRVYFMRGSLDQALFEVQEAVRFDQDSSIIQESLADVLQAKGSNTAALAAYRKALSLDPNNRNIYLKLAYQQAKLGDLAEGELVLQKAVELWPDDPKSYNDLGLYRARHGKVIEAEETYLKALELDQNYPMTLMNLGVLCQQKGQLDKAINYYRQSLALNNQNRFVYYNLGVALMEKGEYEEAGQLFMTALAFDPDDQDVIRQLSEIMYLEEMQKRGAEQGMSLDY